MAAITAIFLTVFAVSGIDDVLKAWAAVGTELGAVTGIIPAYFFGKKAGAQEVKGGLRSVHSAAALRRVGRNVVLRRPSIVEQQQRNCGRRVPTRALGMRSATGRLVRGDA
jgi:hypothetical protein